MSNEKVPHANETTTAPESGTHAAAADYERAEARVFSRNGVDGTVSCALAENQIHKATLGDLLPHLFEDGTDLADAALCSIEKDLELITLALEEDAETYEVVHRLIKLQHRTRVARELHRRIKLAAGPLELDRIERRGVAS